MKDPRRLSTTAIAPPYCSRVDYYDCTGLAFYGGFFYSTWADNSNTTTNNPDPNDYGMDIYVAKVQYR
jgi:hypothetical protein